MAEWCQKCGTYHDVTTAGGCPDKEDKLWVGTYAEGFRAGQESAERRAVALDRALQSLTPGGSEFVHDPDRCVAFVQEARASEMLALKAAGFSCGSNMCASSFSCGGMPSMSAIASCACL